MPRFELGGIALGNLRFSREIFAGQAAARARASHAFAELHEKLAAVVDGRLAGGAR